MQPYMLVDSRPIRLSLLNEGKGTGRVRVRGEFARADQATENKRVYTKKIWEKEINRLSGGFKARSVFGHTDHPADGRTSIDNVSHIVTDLQLENGVLIGEAEILPTTKGLNLLAILQSGCLVGVSSRGFGSTKPNDVGEDVVQEDYKLVTFDFVADPADQTAYPKVVDESTSAAWRFEGVEIAMADKSKAEPKTEAAKVEAVQAEPVKAEPVKVEAPKVEAAPKAQISVESQMALDRAKISAEVLAAIAAQKNEVRNEVRSELLADPAVAGAKTALEQVVGILRPFILPEDAESVVRAKEAEIARLKKDIQERDLKIIELESDNVNLAEGFKIVGYKLYVEHELRKDPDATFLKKIVGDVKQYATSQDLKDKLTAVREELAAKRAEEQKAEEIKAKETARMREITRAATEELEDENAKLREAIEKMTIANNAAAVKMYTEKKLRLVPKSGTARRLIEAAKPTSRADVDDLLENFRTSAPKDEDEAASVRARIRRLSGGGWESDPISEETPRKARSSSEAYIQESTGIDLDELLKLSGTV